MADKTDKQIKIERDNKTDKIIKIGTISSDQEIRDIQTKINEMIDVMKIK